MTAILGISAFYHDSAAALVVDGRIVAAAQEERFSRRKHDHALPIKAIEYCLREANLTVEDLSLVAFYDKPLLKFERLLETYLAFAPFGFKSFAKALPLWLKEKLHIPKRIRAALPGYQEDLIFPEHHLSHAASAFYPSPFEHAAVLTLDGVGEWATASVGWGRGSQVELLKELRFPHSLGLLYSAFTAYCGFRVNSGEYKLMGLAPYGEPVYEQLILDKVLDLKEDGSFKLDLSLFNYCQGLTMTSRAFHKLFGGPPRKPESPLEQRHMDLAASIQRVTETIVLRMANHAFQVTGERNLCLAGGVALNCVANGRIARESSFENIWIQPASGDAGGALGAALLAHYQVLEADRQVDHGDSMGGSRLGPRYGEADVQDVLERESAVFSWIEEEDSLLERVASLLATGKVIGWFHGRMEFGPRALGSRSILGDARNTAMQETMNLKIKFRESFRPFAPVVLAEYAHAWFDIDQDEESPYMLQTRQVSNERMLPLTEPVRKGLARLKQERSSIPAVTHVDGSARLQTVDAARCGRFHRLMNRFYEQTGCPVLVNTSFNVRGEPIVNTPGDALRCFLATDMDVLVLENALLFKDEQPSALKQRYRDHHTRFELD